MRAAVVENNTIKIKELPKPEFAQGQKGAIIKVSGCGLCGSDIVKFKEHVKDGTVLGHEIVGEIVEINSDTDFSIGDKIAMGHHVPCFECVYCKNENYSMCRHFKETNIVPGGFSEYIYASEEHLENTVFKVPTGMDEITASFLEPLACCIRAVKRANLNDGSTSLVVGLGSIGLLMGQAIRAYNQRVIGCDLISERVALASQLNFDKTIISDNIEKAVAEIKDFTDGYGVDAVFMTSGAYQTIPFALQAVRDGGKIVVFSSVPSMNGYSNNEIYYRELTVLGSYSPTPQDLADSMEMLKNNKVIVKNFSHVYNLNQIELAINDTTQSKILKAYIKV